MPAILLDSSIYISALRRRSDITVVLRAVAGEVSLWLSSVVLEELYAGASDRDRHVVERLEQDFQKAKRVVVPDLSDWAETGKVLARLAAKYGYEHIGRGRLTNDALIALSAGRLGITVVTTNPRDFGRLAEFAPFHWQLSEH